MILNLVAMDMLKAKIPPVRSPQQNGAISPTSAGDRMAMHMLPGAAEGMLPNGNGGGGGRGGADIRNRPKIPLPRDDDDDPYSMVTAGQKNGRGGDKPPKLPPRDLNIPKVRIKTIVVFSLCFKLHFICVIYLIFIFILNEWQIGCYQKYAFFASLFYSLADLRLWYKT